MAAGGIFDQLGGGFARYSTDAAWLVPHFEKMLYDNAQLARVYLHAWALTCDPAHLAVASATLDFVVREMRLPDGVFAASLDADTGGTRARPTRGPPPRCAKSWTRPASPTRRRSSPRRTTSPRPATGRGG